MAVGAMAGYALTGNAGGAIGGAAGAGFGLPVGQKFFAKKTLSNRLASGVGHMASAAPTKMVKANIATKFGNKGLADDFLRADVRKAMAARGVNKNISYNPVLSNIEKVSNRKKLGNMSFAQKDPGYMNNIRAGQRKLRENSINVNKFGGAALGALGVYSASRMGSSAISSNRGY